jgi:hypothetical protein
VQDQQSFVDVFGAQFDSLRAKSMSQNLIYYGIQLDTYKQKREYYPASRAYIDGPYYEVVG